MNTFPLIRAKWSNEHSMATLLIVLILYHIPQWKDNPSAIMNSLLLIVFGLALDAIANIVRYKRLWCCVSAAITAAIISLLTPGAPVWVQFVGLSAALLLGKYVWGGTGKNRINPAMVGLLVILIFYSIPYPLFTPSYLFVPAIVLSLPFIRIRPYTAIGFLVGSVAALLVSRDMSLANLISSGVLFWSCIVLTDPVTVTSNRRIGLASGILAGIMVLSFRPGILIFITMILLVNIISFIAESTGALTSEARPKLRIPKVFSYSSNKFLDLSEDKAPSEEAELGIEELTAEEIIKSIKYHDVFGMGGAAFPTDQKLKAVLASGEKNKYLIINGVECDPGLIHDNFILHNYPEEIQKGIEALKNCIDFTSIHLAVKNTEGLLFPEDIHIHKVADRYPVGAERILVKEVLKLSIDHNQLPASFGILILNVQTIYSIYRAFYLNCSSDTRFLTVANLKDRTAQVVKVRLGMKLRDIMEEVYPGSVRIFVGGGIMQTHSADDEAVVDKNTNFIAVGAFPKFKESPQCSQCGNCVANCPSKLKVHRIADLADQGKLKEAATLNAKQCIGCASCSYSCLAGRNLAAKVKLAKDYIA